MRERRNIHVIGGSPVPLSFHQRMGIFKSTQQSPFRPVSQFVIFCHFVHLFIYPHVHQTLPNQATRRQSFPTVPAARSLPLRVPSHAESPPQSLVRGKPDYYSTTRQVADPHRHRRFEKRLLPLLSPRRWDDNQRRVQRLRARFTTGQQIFGLAVRS